VALPQKKLLEADWSRAKEEMHQLLINLARLGQSISYSELSAQLTTVYLHHRAPAFGQLLRQIALEEAEARRPMLAVLVVNKQTGICGAGFFKHAAQLGYDVADPKAFWQTEFDRVHDYWANAD
jgi:hypothetical protein